KHIGKHAEIHSLARARGSNCRDHFRKELLGHGLMSQSHRGLAVAAQLGVKIIAATTDITGAGHRGGGQPIRIHFPGTVGSHTSTSSISGAGASLAFGGGSTPGM